MNIKTIDRTFGTKLDITVESFSKIVQAMQVHIARIIEEAEMIIKSSNSPRLNQDGILKLHLR